MSGRTTRVAAFTGGHTVPSARFRVAQYVSPLRSEGVTLDVFPSAVGTYPPVRSIQRPSWLIRTVADRIPAVLASRGYDVTLLQRELVSTLSTLERFTGRPRVFDVDDAIWLYRGGGFVRNIVKRCDAVICGNSFLAGYFRKLHPVVYQLPTAVDTDRFVPLSRTAETGDIVIGWSGTSGGYEYFGPVIPALRELFRRYPSVRFRVISDHPPDLPGLDDNRVDFVRWSPEREVTDVQKFDIGIMPLADTEWDRGKCSYKMLLYMACGVPAVVSPIGMNCEVLALGSVGAPASNSGEWLTRLSALVEDTACRARMAIEARRVVVERFSVRALAPHLAQILKEVGGATSHALGT